MVPGTDYEQLRELLPWILKTQGMDQYRTALQRAVDAVRLGNVDMPGFFDDDRALVTLTLPDNENFTDDNWMMQLISVDVRGLIARVQELFSQLSEGDYSAFPQAVQDMLREDPEPEEPALPEEDKPGFWKVFLEALAESLTETEEVSEPVEELTDEKDEKLDELIAWLKSELSKYIYKGMGAAGQDGRTISMVVRPGRTIPSLIHMAFEGLSVEPQQVVFAVFMNGKWYVLDTEKAPENEEKTSLDDVLDLFTYEIKGGEVHELPSAGLESVVLPEKEEVPEPEPAELPEPGRKSRPKLD